MILSPTASGTLRPEFHDESGFQVDLPHGTELLRHSALSFTLDGAIEHLPDAPGVSNPTSDHMLESSVTRARRYADRFPRSARAHFSLALSLLAADEFDESLAEFDRASRLNPADPTSDLYAARVLVLTGQIDEATKRYHRVREAMGDSPLLLMHLADLAMRVGDTDSARERWRRVVENRPNSSTAHWQLGALLLAKDDLAGAVHHLRSASRIEPANPDLLVALGLAQWRAGQRKRSMRTFRNAMALAPQMGEAYHTLASLLLQGGQYDEASDVAATRVALAPSDWEALEHLAEASFRTSRPADAGKWLRLALRSARDVNAESAVIARVLSNLGVCDWTLGDLRSAERYLREACLAGPDVVTPYHNLSRLELERGRSSEADAVLDDAEAAFPGHPATRLLRAAVLETERRYDEAIDLLMRWVVDEPDAPRDAWAFLGPLLADAKNQPDKAVPILRRAQERFPNDHLIANNLAYCLLLGDRVAEAREVLESLPSDPRDWDPSFAVFLAATWGLIHLYEGDRQRALEGYMRAESLAEDNHNRQLARLVRQKRHLEFARASMRDGARTIAKREAELGVDLARNTLYQRQLQSLLEGLRS